MKEFLIFTLFIMISSCRFEQVNNDSINTNVSSEVDYSNVITTYDFDGLYELKSIVRVSENNSEVTLRDDCNEYIYITQGRKYELQYPCSVWKVPYDSCAKVDTFESKLLSGSIEGFSSDIYLIDDTLSVITKTKNDVVTKNKYFKKDNKNNLLDKLITKGYNEDCLSGTWELESVNIRSEPVPDHLVVQLGLPASLKINTIINNSRVSNDSVFFDELKFAINYVDWDQDNSKPLLVLSYFNTLNKTNYNLYYGLLD